jgi:hypothetical protein
MQFETRHVDLLSISLGRWLHSKQARLPGDTCRTAFNNDVFFTASWLCVKIRFNDLPVKIGLGILVAQENYGRHHHDVLPFPAHGVDRRILIA